MSGGALRLDLLSLGNGNDAIGSLIPDTYVGTDHVDPERRTGLNSLRNIDEISIVAIPGATSAALQNALINHCELMRYRFAVLDGAPPPNDSMSDVDVPGANQFPSSSTASTGRAAPASWTSAPGSVPPDTA